MELKTSRQSVLYEDSELTIMLATDSMTKGHAIIEPKEQFSYFEKLPADLLKKIMSFAQLYVRIIKKTYNPKGYSMMQNQGQFSDRHYFSLHIIPRFSKEEFSCYYSDIENPQAFEFSRIKEFLQVELKDSLNKKS